MTDVFVHNDINGIIEALLYCKNYANGTPVSAFITELREKYPESAEEINALYAPIVTLEQHLNTIMTGANPERVHFFFDVFGNTGDTPRGMNVANVIMMPSPLNETHAPDLREHVDTIKALPLEKRIEKLSSSILINNEKLNVGDGPNLTNYFDQIEGIPMSGDDKFKLLLAIRHFDEYAEELYVIIRPIVECIEASRPLFMPLLERFKQVHAGIDLDGLLKFVNSIGNLSFDNPEIEVYELYPRLFTAQKICIWSFKLEDCPATARVEINVLYDRVIEYRNRDIPYIGVAQCIKALGNPARLEIMSMLKEGEVHVQGLVDKLGLSFNAVSNHMTKLLLAGLVLAERRGSFVYYHANVEGINWMIDRLRALLPNA